MSKHWLATLFIAGSSIVTVLDAQTPRATTPADTEPKASVKTEGTMTGVLMDATCDPIHNSGALRSSVPGRKTQQERTVTEQMQRTTDPASPQKTPELADATTGRKTPAANKEPTTAQSTGMASTTQTGMPRVTPSGVAGSLDPSGRDLPRSTATATQPGEQARSRADEGGSMSTLRDKYASCQVKPTSTTFALHTNGEVYTFDQAANQMVQDKMNDSAFRGPFVDAAGKPRWTTVKVMGKVDGTHLSITSIEPEKQ